MDKTGQAEREAFEAHYDKQFVEPGFAKHHRHDGNYCTHELSDQWKGWQARAALAHTEQAKDVDFYRGVIAALGALAPHSTHGCTEHDEIVASVGKDELYAAAEPEDIEWAGMDPEFYAAIQSSKEKTA